MDQLEEEDLNLLKKEIQRMTGEETNSHFMILFILISFFRISTNQRHRQTDQQPDSRKIDQQLLLLVLI
jgi:hypothetical protein